jgi:hypothetical protein
MSRQLIPNKAASFGKLFKFKYVFAVDETKLINISSELEPFVARYGKFKMP